MTSGVRVALKRRVWRLRLGGGAVDDFPDIRDKPHVEHPVRFIDHENFHLVQGQILPLMKIEKASRGCHQDIDRLFL